MIEILCAIISGLTRRVDGSDKDWANEYIALREINLFGIISFELSGRKLIQLSVRVLPVLVGAYLLYRVWQPTELYWYLTHIAFGGLISGSMQRGYNGWEFFSLRQITQHAIGMAAYAPLILISPLLGISGILCCFLAGLAHPVGAKLGIKHYTAYAEFISGFFLLFPFFINLFA